MINSTKQVDSSSLELVKDVATSACNKNIIGARPLCIWDSYQGEGLLLWLLVLVTHDK